MQKTVKALLLFVVVIVLAGILSGQEEYNLATMPRVEYGPRLLSGRTLPKKIVLPSMSRITVDSINRQMSPPSAPWRESALSALAFTLGSHIREGGRIPFTFGQR